MKVRENGERFSSLEAKLFTPMTLKWDHGQYTDTGICEVPMPYPFPSTLRIQSSASLYSHCFSRLLQHFFTVTPTSTHLPLVFNLTHLQLCHSLHPCGTASLPAVAQPTPTDLHKIGTQFPYFSGLNTCASIVTIQLRLVLDVSSTLLVSPSQTKALFTSRSCR